jgi:hypothetical protein
MKRIFFSLIFTLCAHSLLAMGSLPTLDGPKNNSTAIPTIFIAAPPEKVESIIISRAASKGSVIKPYGNGQLILERELPSISPQVEAACGSGWAGRKVRVVITLQAQNGGTLATERRFIVSNSPTGSDCALPLSPADYAQSMAALGEVKAQAEGSNAGQ